MGFQKYVFSFIHNLTLHNFPPTSHIFRGTMCGRGHAWNAIQHDGCYAFLRCHPSRKWTGSIAHSSRWAKLSLHSVMSRRSFRLVEESCTQPCSWPLLAYKSLSSVARLWDRIRYLLIFYVPLVFYCDPVPRNGAWGYLLDSQQETWSCFLGGATFDIFRLELISPR